MDSLREQFENLVEGVGAEQNWVREEGHILVSLAQGRQQRVALTKFLRVGRDGRTDGRRRGIFLTQDRLSQ